MNKAQILQLLQQSTQSVTQKIENNPGVLHCIQNRNKFEKWLQIELLGELLIRTVGISDLSIKLEAEFSNKQSKKGDTVDLAILKNNEKFLGIELKVIPTNYKVTGFSERGPKAITDSITSMINDLNKTELDGYELSVSLGFIFPFPANPKHRNIKDFEKQKIKIAKAGNVIEVKKMFLIDEPHFKASFECYQYILWKNNVAEVAESKKAA